MSLEPVFAPTDASRPHITVRPQAQEAATPEPRWKGSFQKATLGDQNGAAWGGNGFGADDFIDLINPLQHIPVVGHIYRELTGDTASAEAKIIGGGVFGGPVGLIASAVSAIIEQESGQSITQNAMALMDDSKPPAPAQAAPEPKPQQLSALPPQAKPATLEDLMPRMAAPEPAPAPVTTPRPAAPSLSEEEQHKHEAILELFGDQLASLTQTIQQDQYGAYAEQVKSQLTA